VTPADLNRALADAARAAVADGEIDGPIPEDTHLSWEDGRYVTPLPLRMAAGRRPGEVAKIIAARLTDVGDVAIREPGFLTITPSTPGALARHIIETPRYGEIGIAAETWPDRPRTFANPGFVVRFAYTRAAAVRRHAEDLGLDQGDPDVLSDPYEVRLLGALAELPSRGAQAVRQNDATPYKRQLVKIADAYHDVHERCPALPKGDEPAGEKHAARLTLAEAVRISLNNGLRTLGEIPEEQI
jgi:arginyl-tRNA synthetase